MINLENRVNKVDMRIDVMDDKLDNMAVDIAIIKTDTKWTKKVLMILLVAILGSGLTIGGKIAFDGTEIVKTVMAQQEETK